MICNEKHGLCHNPLKETQAKSTPWESTGAEMLFGSSIQLVDDRSVPIFIGFVLVMWGFHRLKHPKTNVWMAWLIAWIMPLLCFVCIFFGLNVQDARETGSLVAFHSIFCHLLLIAALIVAGHKMHLKQFWVGFPLALVLYEGVYRLILYWLFP